MAVIGEMLQTVFTLARVLNWASGKLLCLFAITTMASFSYF